jgi:hypothetical protein
MNKTFLVSLLTRAIMYVVGAKLVSLGFTQSEAEQGIGSISEQVVGYVLLAIAGIWEYAHHQITLHTPPPAKDDEASKGRGGGMLSIMLMALAMLSMTSGCAMFTPAGGASMTTEQKLQLAGRSMETIETSIMLAQATKAIDAKTAKELLDAGELLHAAYDTLLDGYQNGKPMDFDAAHAAFNNALRSYLQRLNERGVKVEQKPNGEVSYVDHRRGVGASASGAGARWLGERMAAVPAPALA